VIGYQELKATGAIEAFISDVMEVAVMPLIKRDTVNKGIKAGRIWEV
jgi:hypothetical protein